MEIQELELSNEAFEQIKEKFFYEISKVNNELSIVEKSLEKKNKKDYRVMGALSARRSWGLNDISCDKVLVAKNIDELCRALVREIEETKRFGMSDAVKAANAENQENMYTEKITDLQEENEKLQKENEEFEEQLEHDEDDPVNKLWTLCNNFDYSYSYAPVNAFTKLLAQYITGSKDDPQSTVNTVSDANKVLQHLAAIHEIVKD